MPTSFRYTPDMRFPVLGPEFADPVEPARFPAEIARFRNQRAARSVGLDELTDEEWAAAFAHLDVYKRQMHVKATRRDGPDAGVGALENR